MHSARSLLFSPSPSSSTKAPTPPGSIKSPTATQTPPPSQAPVPTQIAAAHTIFLVNNGADTNFPLSADDTYNQVYAALQAWGHFQLVTSPDQADLVFQLRGIAPVTGVEGSRAGVYAINSPAFQLAIKDPRSNVTLWTINSPVQVAGRKSARAHWLDIGVTNLVSRVKVLANQPLDETETADLTTYPHYHGTGFTIALIGITVGAAVATGLIMKHEFDQNVANQNAALCAQNTFFCNMPTP